MSARVARPYSGAWIPGSLRVKHWMLVAVAVCCAALWSPRNAAEAKGGKVKAPSPQDVHAAIKRGATWLQNRYPDGLPVDKWHSPVELVALTMAHAHVDRKDKVFVAALKEMETCKLRYTYRVATMAMALSHINAFKYRARLAHCAQWLVDTQCPGGEWGYPGVTAGRSIGAVAADVKPPDDIDPDPRKPLVIQSRRATSVVKGEPVRKGDFSNTQYAILGLRACREANIQIPKTVWKLALDYMTKFQQEDGGWGYVQQGEQDMTSYASLTCAGACGAAVCLYALGKKQPKSQPIVARAVKWLKEHWDPTQNFWIDNSSTVAPRSWQYYHLYSVERVGSVLRMKTIGKRNWYAEGARWLLEQQRADGSWEDPQSDRGGSRYLVTADTCFAILFLARATPPLTGG